MENHRQEHDTPFEEWDDFLVEQRDILEHQVVIKAMTGCVADQLMRKCGGYYFDELPEDKDGKA